ncbi:hypothetical protein JTB14_030527 [Gonioctena quinquepunctata]|nr:hypothetical protein JTB14_030527 [Gonioctena quinquepunctata]
MECSVVRPNEAEGNVEQLERGQHGYEIEFKEIVGINIRFLKILGIIRPKFQTLVKTVFYFTFIGSTFLVLFLSELVNLYLNSGDISKLASASYLFLTHVVQLLKYWYFYKYSHRIKTLEHTINRKEFQPKSQHQRLILEKYVRRSKTITIVFWLACLATCSFWTVDPFLEDGVTLPLPGWFPFDVDTRLGYVIAFSYQISAATMNGIVIIGMDTLMADKIASERRNLIVEIPLCANRGEGEDTWLEQWKEAFNSPDYVISQRRSSIARSPTGAGSLATTNLETEEVDHSSGTVDRTGRIDQTNERKRHDMSPKETLSEENLLARRAFDMLVDQVALLKKVLDQSYEPREELVDISRSMCFQTEELEKYMTWQESGNKISQNEDLQKKEPAQLIENAEMSTQVCKQDLDTEMGLMEQKRPI